MMILLVVERLYRNVGPALISRWNYSSQHPAPPRRTAALPPYDRVYSPGPSSIGLWCFSQTPELFPSKAILQAIRQCVQLTLFGIGRLIIASEQLKPQTGNRGKKLCVLCIMDNSRQTSDVRALSGIMPPITRSSDVTGNSNKRAKHWAREWRMESEKGVAWMLPVNHRIAER